MRRIITTIFVGLILLSNTLIAQAAFPLTLKTYWTPNAASDGVTSYKLAFGTGSPVVYGPTIIVGTTVINDVNCPLATNPAGCIMQTVTIPSAGVYTFSVIAVAAYGESNPALLQVNINTPGNVVWLKIAK